MKIVFLEDEQTRVKEHKSYGNDLANIFRIAEELTDTDLDKIELICNQLEKEASQND